MDKIYVILSHPGRVILNTQAKKSMNFLHSIILTVIIGSVFYFYGRTSLVVIKTYPSLIGSKRKICEMLPLLLLIILYHHILTLSRLCKILQVHFELHGTKDMMKHFHLWTPFKLSYLGI